MIKVLLIEDNDVDAQLTQDLLSEWSTEEFQVARSATLAEGLSLLSRERFDAMLLDLSLPDAFGLPTVREVHASSPTIPVVVLSGVSDQNLALQAVRQGAQDYLVKGQGHPELLARAIRYAIERKRFEEHLTYLAQYDHLTGESYSFSRSAGSSHGSKQTHATNDWPHASRSRSIQIGE
jgi:two-component system cell cycle response regulator